MAEVPAASRHQGGVELQGFLDRAAVREAVENWGLWRDSGRWEQLKALYTPDAIVHTTWFVGSAAEFVAPSPKLARCCSCARRCRASRSMSPATCASMTGCCEPLPAGASACATASTRRTASTRSTLQRQFLWILLRWHATLPATAILPISRRAAAPASRPICRRRTAKNWRDSIPKATPGSKGRQRPKRALRARARGS